MSSEVWISLAAAFGLVLVVWGAELIRDRKDRRKFDRIVRDIHRAKRKRPSYRVPWGAEKNRPGRKQREKR